MNKQKLVHMIQRTYPAWSWIVMRYYPQYDEYMRAVEIDTLQHIIDLMNQMWFELPDHIFNISENPPGWQEFIAILEEYMDSRHTEENE
jgi:hypothetical protein